MTPIAILTCALMIGIPLVLALRGNIGGQIVGGGIALMLSVLVAWLAMRVGSGAGWARWLWSVEAPSTEDFYFVFSSRVLRLGLFPLLYVVLGLWTLRLARQGRLEERRSLFPIFWIGHLAIVTLGVALLAVLRSVVAKDSDKLGETAALFGSATPILLSIAGLSAATIALILLVASFSSGKSDPTR